MATPLSAAEVQKQMAANSAAWKTATPQMQTQLHQANLDLAKQTGQSYNAAQGTYSAPVAAKPVSATTPQQTAYASAAEAFKQQHWYNGGTTATPSTESQNLAAVINQPGNTVKNNPTPFISGILGQAQKDTAAQQVSMPTPTTQPIQPTTTAAPISATQTTGNQSGYPGGLTTAQISADAAARMAKQRAGIEGAVTAGKAARKSLFDYNAKNTNDSRVLENSQNARTLSPFSGKTGYLQSQIERGRGIDDTFTNQNYTNDVNALDAQLTSFDAMAPEQQQALYDQLIRQERDYGLQEGALTGQFQGNQTLAARTADQNYQLGLSGLSGRLPGGGGQTLAAQSQGFNQNLATNQYNQGVKNDTFNQNMANKQFDYTVSTDSRDFDYKKAQDSWNQTFQKQQYNDQKAAQLWEQTFKTKSSQQDMANAAASRGLQWASLNQRDKEFIADSAYREKTYNAQQAQQGVENGLNRDKLDWEKSSANPSNLPRSSSSNNFNLDDFKGYINQNYYKDFPANPSNPFDPNKIKQFDSSAARKYIIGQNLPDDQTDQLLKLYNLPTG